MAPPEAHPEPERKMEPPQEHSLRVDNRKNGQRSDHGEEPTPLKAQEDQGDRRLEETHLQTQEMVQRNARKACARWLAKPAETVRKAAKTRLERTQ